MKDNDTDISVTHGTVKHACKMSVKSMRKRETLVGIKEVDCKKMWYVCK
jgi:hypothetical protein